MMKIMKMCFRMTTQMIKSDQQLVRLSKWLSVKSICSRKQAERFIELGLVRVNQQRVYQNILVPTNAQMKAFTPTGIKKQKPVIKLWMINKPRGYICTHYDAQNRHTIYELLPQDFNIFGKIMSVGRLDYNSQGLLLLTNDVHLKNILENPQTKMLRYYHVKVHGRVTPQKLENMSQTNIINGQQYGPLRVTIDRELSTNVWLKVSMMTGKNRQIRRIMQKCNLQVNKLIRQEYGPYKLNNLNHGQIKQVEITPKIFKQIQLSKAKELNNQKRSLIQIDIRQQAIKYAIEQNSQKKNQKIVQQNENTKLLQNK